MSVAMPVSPRRPAGADAALFAAPLPLASPPAPPVPPPPSSPVVLVSVRNGIQTIKFNRPERLNAWSPEMMKGWQEALASAASDDAVKAVILTGAGRYYCSGVDFGASLKPMLPKSLITIAKAENQKVFDSFLDFPKPIFVAVNGAAVGACVTAATLCDLIVASDQATFHTPFKALGITPEGCSSFNFPRLLGERGTKIMLEEGRKVDAFEALEIGLVNEVVKSTEGPSAQDANEDTGELLSRVQRLAEEWVAEGRPRKIIEQGLVQKLKEVNVEESQRLAESFVGRAFLEAQEKFAMDKKKTSMAWMFWAAKFAMPLLSKL